MKNAENKWIGWVEDAEGYMVRFIGPTSRAWSQRKVNEAALALGSAAGVYGASELGYALRTKFAYFDHTNGPDAYEQDYYRRLPIADLNLLINVVQG
jgi:hypothetical protein